MHIVLYLLVLGFGCSSYIIGVKEMLQNKYSPSVFSRIVWLFLAIISFAGVITTKSTVASVLLSGIFLIGNATICTASFWKGTREIGTLELICLAILLASGVVWLVFNAPLISLAMSLFAHFVGGVPTYRRVWKHPASESAGFWSLFFVASMVSVIASLGQHIEYVIFPIYFTLFDGGMTVLSLRKTSKNHPRTAKKYF